MGVMSVEWGLMIASIIIFIGFIGSVLLNRHNIPDAIFLIILGYVLGPGLGLVDIEILKGAAPYIGAVALISIMFESSFGINIRELFASAKPALILAFGGFALSTLATTLLLYYVIGFYPDNILMSLLVGTIIGGGSGAIIVSVIQRISVPTKVQVTLSIESVLTDVLVIIFTETVLLIITLQMLQNGVTLDLRNVGGSIASSFSISVVLGVLAGWILANLLDRFKKEKHVYTMTIAYLILIYVATQSLNGSGAIAVLTCGIVLTNFRHIPFLFEKRSPESLTYQLYSLESMHSELTLLLKIFFFVEVGIIMNIRDLWTIVISLLLSVILFLVRFPVSLLVAKSLNFGEASLVPAEIISFSYARGLAAAVMAVRVQNEFELVFGELFSEAVEFILQVTSGVILFTNLFFTVGIALLRNKVREFYY